MADIDALIARPPAFSFNSLPDPLEGYQQGREQYRQRQMQNEMSQGLPRGADGQIDWTRAIERIADVQAKYGSPTNAANVLLQAKQMSDDANFAQRLEGILTPGGGQPSAAAPRSTPPPGFAPPPTVDGPVPQQRPPIAQPPQTAAAPDVQQQIAQLTALLPRARTPQQAAAITARINQLQPDQQIMTTPDGTILSINKRTGGVTPIYQAPKPPTFGRIGGDNDAPQYGFIDPNSRSVTPIQGGQTDPANPYAQPGKTTDEQNKAAGFAGRMFQAEAILRQPDIVDAATNSFERARGDLGNAPYMPAWGSRYVMSENYQRYDQAKRNFINAVLRRESGAVISPEEFANADKQYFPLPGETPKQIQQKRENREEAIRGIAGAAGKNYTPPMVFDRSGKLVPNPRAGRSPDQQQAAAPERPRAQNPQTGAVVEWNGSAWVPVQ